MDKNLSKAISNPEGQPPKPASYYHMLKHTWMVEEQRKNEPPTGHTEIGSSSTEHNEEIRMQNLHIDAEHDAEKLTNKYREEFTIAVSKLAVINLQIENIKGKITINSNQRSTLEKVKAYIDSNSFTIEGFHKLTEDLTLEISKTDSDRQMDHSHDRATSSSDQSKKLNKRELKISELRQLVWYYHYKLENNEKQYAKLQENLTKAINDQKDFQNKGEKALIKLHKLDDLSLRDIPDQQIDDPQTRVNSLKKQLVEAIKTTELHAKQCEKSHKEEKEVLDTVYQLTRDLTSAEQALAQFKKQRSPSPESQPSSSLEEAQPTQAEIKVWDLQISQYKHTCITDYLHTKLIQHQAELDSLAKELQELPRPTQEDGTLHEQFQKILSWRNKLLENQHKLARKTEDTQFQHDKLTQIITSFSQSAQEIYDKRLKTLMPTHFVSSHESKNNVEQINDGFKKEYELFQKNLENAKNLQKDLDESNKNNEKTQNLKKELANLISSAEETLHMLAKNLQIINDVKKRVSKDLKNICEGDLAEAQKQLDDIMAKMPPQDHLYFPWYRRNEYATENTVNYSSNLPKSCVVLATMTLMHMLGANMELVPEREVAKILRLNLQKGSHIIDVPKVLKSFNISETYNACLIETTKELENILNIGKLPIIVGITNKKMQHAIIVEEIREESGLKFVRILDPLYASKGNIAYEVLMEDFQKAWQPREPCAVPTKALNTWQYTNAKCLEEVNNLLVYPWRPKFD